MPFICGFICSICNVLKSDCISLSTLFFTQSCFGSLYFPRILESILYLKKKKKVLARVFMRIELTLDRFRDKWHFPLLIHEHSIFLHLSILKFLFKQCFLVGVGTYCTSLIKFVPPKYFIFLNIIVDKNFQVSISHLLVVHKNNFLYVFNIL